MPVLLPNTVLATARSAYNAATGQTTPPTPYLTGVAAYLAPIRAAALAILPDNAVAQVAYVARVESGTDIVVNDQISAISLLDGLTPWPTPFPAGTICLVRYVQESAPGILAERVLYLAFLQTAGPAY